MSSRSVERKTTYGPGATGSYSRALIPGVSELSRALSDEDRKALLERIARSLSIHHRTEEQIVHGELRKERKSELIRADMESLSPWERFLYWLKRLFSGSGDDSVFVAFRLNQLRDRINEEKAHYVHFEHHTAEPDLAIAVRSLYVQAQRLIPFFQMLWKEEGTLRMIVDALLLVRVPDARHSLNQFVSTQELQEEFRRSESRNVLKQLVLDRISEYIESIHPDVIRQIEEGLLPAYYMKDIVLFDYGGFFSAFQTDLATVGEKDDPSFERVSIPTLMSKLESLYLAIYNARRIPASVGIFPEALEYYIRLRQGSENPGENLSSQSISHEAELLRKSLVALRKSVDEFKNKVPLEEIVRYFKEDPYYRFMAYVPRLKLKDFYYANLKIELLQDLDSRFHDLRTGVVGRMIQDVFQQPLKNFEYYHPAVRSTIQRAGVNGLNNYQTLQIVYNYIEQVYRPDLHNFMRIIGRIIPVRSRETVSDLSIYLAGLDDVAERLRGFDSAFSPTADEGKTLYRFRYVSELDPQQQAVFKALVNQLDREGRNIIEAFVDQIRGIRDIFLAIRKIPPEPLNERYAGFVGGQGATKTPFTDELNRLTTLLDLVDKIVGQMIVIEAER